MVLQANNPFADDLYTMAPLASFFVNAFAQEMFRRSRSSNPGLHYGKPPHSNTTSGGWTNIPIHMAEDTDSSGDDDVDDVIDPFQEHKDVSDAIEINAKDDAALNALWIPELHLSFRDMLELRDGEQLSDKHVFAAQKLLQFQFPHISGCQDTCLAQTNGFAPMSRDQDSIQILHTRASHWVLSAAISGHVFVFDSLYATLSGDLKRQLKQIYGPEFANKKGYLNVNIPQIQSQRGVKDCGLFAIAIAFELCQGNDPANYVFNQQEMREHLLKCFQNRELSSFPHIVSENLDRFDEKEIIDCWVDQ